MKIGLYDVDSHNFPSLPLMKISAYHKSKGDEVEIYQPLFHYDKVYVSKVFGDEYSTMDLTCINADKVEYGGTGFAIVIKDGKEVYIKANDKPLPPEIEHAYPDYSLYPKLTKDTAYGFLTRGCPNNCGFCIVSKKEGRKSIKVADLSEWWNGQKKIKLLDPNLLACKDKIDLLIQLKDSKAKIDFTQGLDARFINDDVSTLLSQIKKEMVHFAFDFIENEKAIIKGLETYKKFNKVSSRENVVYILTNYNTTIDDDIHRIKVVMDLGFSPDIRIYRKPTAPKVLKDLQRWCNNRVIFRSTTFSDYIPRKDGKSIKELYGIKNI